MRSSGKEGFIFGLGFLTVLYFLAVRVKPAELTGNRCHEFGALSLGLFFLHLTPCFSLHWSKVLAKAGYSKGLALPIVSGARRINQSCRLEKTMLKERTYSKWRKRGMGRRG